MSPSTVERVHRRTTQEVNARIRRRTEQNVARVATQGREAIERRLAELDREWDIERALEANAATVVLVGCGLGAVVHRRFFALPVVAAGFLLQHALQGWCPPLPIFRRRGVRTPVEIAEERYALKAARGISGTSRGRAEADRMPLGSSRQCVDSAASEANGSRCATHTHHQDTYPVGGGATESMGGRT